MGKSGGKWRKMFIFAHDNKNHLKYADEIPWKHRGEDRRKGPRFLPATFRKVLQTGGCDTLVMRKDIHEKCLVLYPENVWNERVDALRSRVNEWDDTGQMVMRQYMKEAEVVTLDGNGRFLIPKRYLQMAEIDQAVRFIGMTDTIEIWAAEKAEQPFMTQEDFAAKLKAIMAPQQ